MKIFVSSLIANMTGIRAAARTAIESLGYSATMAEDFGARAQSPQITCLEGVRSADAVVLILGASYGAKQASGLSATHEEYREAKSRGNVLSFVDEGVTFEPEQAAFVREVQAWDTGLFRGGFSNTTDLQTKITRALHEWQLSRATSPFDSNEVLQRALSFFPKPDRHGSSNGSTLIVSVSGGPTQAILRPSAIENEAFAERLLQAALFGQNRIFDSGFGSKHSIKKDALVLEQGERERSSIQVDSQGSIVIRLLMKSDRSGMSVIIEEDVREQLTAGLRYASWLLEDIDPTNRLSHVVLAAQIAGTAMFGWRTRSQQSASGNSGSVRMYDQDGLPPVHLAPPHRVRAALRSELELLVDDLLVLLRRQFKA